MSRGRFSRALSSAALLSVAACARSAGGPAPVAPPHVAGPSVGVGVGVGVRVVAEAPVGPPRPDPALLEMREAAWAVELPPLHVECANTGASADLRVYGADGTVDASAVEALSQVAADANGPFPLNERLARLAVKAAHHFDASTLEVVSAYRKPRGKAPPDHHAKGEALDFRLRGVDYRKLAAYLRSLPRVGVGVYTDRRTHYVHLDVRDRSFHWLDASPPGVTWREGALPDPKQAERDASYTSDSDLPLDGPPGRKPPSSAIAHR
jgi:uncharacterized protein YcbK (DUF882 family)